MKEYRIVKRILRYKKRYNLSYRAMGELLGCEPSSLCYLLTKSKSSLAFQVVDKFESLEKKSIAVPDAEDEAWGD